MLLAIPVTLSSSLSSLTRVVDVSMIFRRLQTVGYESAVVASMFGSYSTLAVPLYNLPSSLVAGISLSLVPTLTHAVEERREKSCSELAETSLKMCLFLSVPCSVGMALFSKPILSLLFMGEEAAVDFASPLLSVLAFSVVSSCLMGITNAILQACRKAMLPIFSMLVGMTVKIVSAYILMGIPALGIYGAAISTLLCNLASVGMNLYFIERKTEISLDFARLSAVPMAVSFLSICPVHRLWQLLSARLSSSVAFLISAPLCLLLYFWIGGRMGMYGAREVKMLPGGDKIYRMLDRLGFIKRKDVENEQRGYDQRASRKAEV
jgi:stage V sporulation protein B